MSEKFRFNRVLLKISGESLKGDQEHGYDAAAVRAVLKEQHGLTEAELDRVTTPIGLEIGAETPAEVAISIAAQMIALRAKKQAEEVL